MKETIIIKNINGKNQLLKVDEIVNLLKSNGDKLFLIFESGKPDDEYRKLLQKELKKYHVFNARRIPEIWIYRSIATSKILEKKEEIHNAARTFRDDGIKLMKILGETYQINPFNSRELFDLKRKSRDTKQRGPVNDEWDFYFHGAECQFKNQKTGQIIELVITNGSEFGGLNSYFFLQYLKTTPKFKMLANFFSDDSKSVTKAFNLLEDLGELERIDNDSFKGLIAKN